MQFDDLNLIEPLLRAVRAEGYSTPTPIQEQSIPQVLAGRDLLGCAQTGTGKTAAFALPILQHLAENPRQGNHIRVLVLAPTRELASQIGDSFRAYGRNTGVKQLTIFGGVGQQPQVDKLRQGPNVLVAAPGRLLDLMNQGFIKLDKIEVFVLDEADRMLDMGFIHDVRRVIAALPKQRQTLLFSATMPEEIQELAHNILIDPVKVEVTPVSSTVEKIDQSVFFVEKKDKPALLESLLQNKDISRVLVFTRTKHGANKVVQRLEGARIHAEAIHGNKSQSARENALKNFKSGRTRVLVATDIAARGLDVEEITHIINYDLPNEPETYVHRIGRTARAGASGIAYSFCDTEERAYLRDIERLIKLHVPVVREHPYQSPLGVPEPTDLNRRGGQRSQPRPQPERAENNGQRPQRSRNGRGNRQQGERPQGERSNNNGQRQQGNRPQAAQVSRDNRPQADRPKGERRHNNNQPPRDNNRPQGDRPAFGNGSYKPQGVGARDDMYSNEQRPSGQAQRKSDMGRTPSGRPQGSTRPFGQRPHGQGDSRSGGNSSYGDRRNDGRQGFSGQRDNNPPSDAAAVPAAPVRRKRPLPPPDQREQPVLTDRFGNPLPMKPKNKPADE
ncbi:MAG: DEAD/DEAH box helicase [Anaerolineae bacterium]|nr:DEAD/DEAH box helicase [Anaerolineae bacterium]